MTYVILMSIVLYFSQAFMKLILFLLSVRYILIRSMPDVANNTTKMRTQNRITELCSLDL